MDLSDVLVFAKVVQAGSFVGGARVLGMPKSTVSRKISGLEGRLGARLLHRTTRKISLTEAGRAYYERAARVVAEIETAELEVAEMQAAPRGLLRVTAPINLRHLGSIVASFHSLYPDVRVEMVCTDRVVDLIEEGFDMAVRAGQLVDSTLIGRRLGALRSWIVASPAFVKRNGSPTTLADLGRYNCLRFGAGAELSIWRLRNTRRTISVEVAGSLVVNDFEVLREAAVSGLGLAQLPAHVCADELRSGRLVRVLGAWRSPETPLFAVYPGGRHLSTKLRAFLDHLAAATNPPPWASTP